MSKKSVKEMSGFHGQEIKKTFILRIVKGRIADPNHKPEEPSGKIEQILQREIPQQEVKKIFSWRLI